MEIANNYLQTTTPSQVDSQSPLSETSARQGKGAKKKGKADDSSFDASMDGAVLALLQSAQAAQARQTQAQAAGLPAQPVAPETPELGNAQQKGIEKPLGASAADLIAQLGKQASAQADLSTKQAAAKQAAAGGGGATAPSIASLFQAKAQQSANGITADAFVAGPDRPWSSRWVFGGNQPSPEAVNAAKASGAGQPTAPASLESLMALVEKARAAAEGGDETQLKHATESASTELDALKALASQYGAQVEGVTQAHDDGREKLAPKPVGLVSGGDYLALASAARAPADSRTGSDLGGSLSGREESGAKPDLQVLTGGLSGGDRADRLEGGLRPAKDELKSDPAETYVFGAAPMAAQSMDHKAGAIPPQQITGHVVPGSMMRDRLATDTVHNVATGIRGMSNAGGGEMRIKMNPGNLGELSIRVSTNGKDVGLKVQASDPAAKKIIEESLGALRDSLAAQSLALGRVDVVVAPHASQDSSGMGSQPGSSHQQQQLAGGLSQGGFDGRGAQQGSYTDRFGDEASSSGSARIATARGGSSRYVSPREASGRLDVMA